ncbi:MAG: hypothetical protein M3342_25140 [Bacteroidota bacterium]|nr:hypothetical protein [Flavisolibacter sp.]MDQ3847273.1 hypothetical protein [Bacteroidota bacterium]
MHPFIQKLSKQAFWDTNMTTIDPETHAAFVIEKVFEYGTWQDMLAVTRYYGEERVKSNLVKSRFFFPDTISLISTIFNINREEMACSTSKPHRLNASNSLKI